MEEEAYFLWAVYENYAYIDYNTKPAKRRLKPIVKKLCLRKNRNIMNNGDYQHKRVHIDFDPIEYIEKKHAYLIVLMMEDNFHFVGVTETEEEAAKEVEVIKKGRWRSFAEGKENMVSVEIIPCFVGD